MILLAVLVHLSTAEPPVIDCNLVRQYVETYGKPAALAWAIKRYSWADIKRARECLK